MAIQYIGARYVPKYIGPWVSNVTYEPLSIVTDAVRNSYISKTTVPAGVQLSNTEYWALSALYNASDVVFNQRIEAAEAEIATLDNSFSALDARVSDVQAETAPIKSYSGYTMRVFGDSNTVFPDVAENQRWPAIVAARLGATLHVHGVTGTCWQTGVPAVSGGVRGNFLEQIEAAPSDDECRLVCIMGGINDIHYGDYNTTAFGQAVNATVQACVSKYPNALIVSMMDGGKQAPNNRMLAYHRTLMRRGTGAVTGAITRAITVPLADLWQEAGLWYNANHYAFNGHLVIATRLLAALYGNGISAPCAPYRETVIYNASNPSTSGYYGMRTDSIVTVDPATCTRRDCIRITFNASMGATGGATSIPAGTEIVTVPGLISFAGINSDAQTTVEAGGQLLQIACSNYDSLTDSPVISVRAVNDIPLTGFNGASLLLSFDSI